MPSERFILNLKLNKQQTHEENFRFPDALYPHANVQPT
jgi:hypothetical protein